MIPAFDSKDKRDQLVKEISSLSEYDCPNLVQFFGVFFDKGRIQICLQYMNKGSLDSLVKKQGALNEAQLQILARSVF